MRTTIRLAVAAILATMGVAVATPASAAPIDDVVSSFTYTRNMHPMGYSPRTGTINSDLAFWGDLAVQATMSGSV